MKDVTRAKIEFINHEKKLQLYVSVTLIVVIGLFATLIIRNNTLKRKKDQLQLMMTEANIVAGKAKAGTGSCTVASTENQILKCRRFVHK